MEFRPFKLGKYLLLERLATGGMAEVYRAKASGAGGFEKQLAIKRILPNYSSNEEFRRMFEYEARLSSQLSHANIVQIYDFVKMGDTYLLAMEYVNGKNLRQFVNKVRKGSLILPLEFGVYIINEVAKGLDYAHKRSDDLTGSSLYIIHRDMSPQNVMVSYDGAVKIVDFGIAKAKDRVDETRSGVIKGKFGYMSPEQANGEPIDHRSDIFSTGIILFELLTGKRLFAAENDLATLKMIQECKIPAPGRINPKLSGDLEKIILKSLAKDPRNRYQDGGLLHRHLQEFLYKHYPSFSQKEFADYIQETFTDDISQEKKRYEELHRQSIPFSQGGAIVEASSADIESLDDLVEGNLTASRSDMTTAVTVDESIEELINISQKKAAQKSASTLEPSSKLSKSAATEEKQEDSNIGKTEVESVFSEEEDSSVSSFRGTKRFIPTLLTPNPPAVESTVGQTPEDSGSDREVSEKENLESSKPETFVAQTSADQETFNSEPKPSLSAHFTLGGEKEKGEFVSESALSHEGKDKDEALSPSDEGGPSAEKAATAAPVSENPAMANGEKKSEINIELSSFKNTGRQRYRSISAVSELEERKPESTPAAVVTNKEILKEKPLRDWDAIELSSLPHVKKNKARDSLRPRRELKINFKQVGSLLSLAFLLLVLTGTLYFYRFHLNGNIPGFVREYVQAQPQETKEVREQVRERVAANTPKESEETKAVAECVVLVDSDPPGAKVMVGDREVGLTGVSFTVPCNQTSELALRHEGFETITEKIHPKESNTKIFKALTKLQMGTLELIVNRNANVYLEGKLVKEAIAGNKFEITLNAHKQQTVRFVNKILNIDTTRSYLIEEGTRKIDSIRLEEHSKPALKSKRRRPSSEE